MYRVDGGCAGSHPLDLSSRCPVQDKRIRVVRELDVHNHNARDFVAALVERDYYWYNCNALRSHLTYPSSMRIITT